MQLIFFFDPPGKTILFLAKPTNFFATKFVTAEFANPGRGMPFFPSISTWLSPLMGGTTDGLDLGANEQMLQPI